MQAHHMNYHITIQSMMVFLLSLAYMRHHIDSNWFESSIFAVETTFKFKVKKYKTSRLIILNNLLLEVRGAFTY